MPEIKRISGVAYIKADARQYTLEASLTLSIQKESREGKTGLSGVAGYGINQRVPFVEATAYTTNGFSVSELLGITNATVTVELANGKNYIFMEAWQAGDLDVDGANGTAPLRFESMNAKEI